MARVNPSIFREYDIRGLVGEDLTQDTVRTIGLAYGTFLRRNGVTRAVVGRDCRLSSFAYSQAIADALLETGVDVIDIGLVTTPVLYFARIHYGIEGGVMVTGSHNPPEYNGFKLAFGPDTLYGEGIQEIRRIAESGSFMWGNGKIRKEDVIPAYVEDMASRVKLGPRKVKVVVDAGNGAAGPVAAKVLERIGADFVPMYFEPDGTFPNHHPDPTVRANLEDLKAEVLATGAQLGIAFDGDADRIGVVDREGNPVWGDRLQVIYWREILAKHPGALALIEVKCSQSLVDAVVAMGGKPEFTRTGHSLIKAKMKESGALFTGEMSGHMFFRDEHYGYDDALYAAVRLLRILSNSDEDLNEMLRDIPAYHSTPEIRVYCPDEEKFKIVERLTGELSKTYEVITVDGARVLFGHGWGLIRASNTQPALVLRAESRSEEGLSEIKKVIEEALGGFPAVGKIEWD
ncbi:MAG TPA: phosphomannomutase/phosphoglucomutase [Firmicutes bacterium]|nr:phosphomannomutase/phosphoglucomutase [Candidatus Fermentithermobacillaceae bacterium]